MERAVDRAKPLLGTLVVISVEGLPYHEVNDAIEAAFAEIELVHELMSFHKEDSDVARLNRCTVDEHIVVHPYTMDVIRSALELSSLSDGAFDISVGAKLVDWNFLPRPLGRMPDAKGSWRDIEISADGKVIFHRPLWIDLGGIAKGYAVDCAMEVLQKMELKHCVVNAGGDIKVIGKRAERIIMDTGFPAETLPIIELRNGSVASSTGVKSRRWHGGKWIAPHLNGVTRYPLPTDRFISVVADRCIVADALTKVVMAKGKESLHVLGKFGAVAHIFEPLTGWEHINAEAGNT